MQTAGIRRSYYVRGTFTDEITWISPTTYFILRILGFEQISIEPVVGRSHTEPYAIRKEDLPKIFEEYDKLAKIMVEREKKRTRALHFFHFMIDLDRRSLCVTSGCPGCGSGTEYLAVTPWGDLYPCHQFVGQEQFLMGNVWTMA